MKEYLLSMQGAIDGVSAQDYLRHAAELIALYGKDDMLAQALVNYLAPVMAVYYGGELVLPDLKTVYGVPTDKFFEKQAKWKTEIGRSNADRLVQESYAVTTSDGVEVQVAFRLHSTFPSPVAVELFTQATKDGLVTLAPVATSTVRRFFTKSNVEAIKLEDWNGNDMLDAILKTWKAEDAAQWVEPGGFAPFKLWMPGTYFQVFARTTEFSSEQDIMYALAAAVRWKVSPVTGSLQVRGFIHDPICLLDDSDREKVMALEDPVPEDLTVVAPENVAEGTQEPGHASGPSPAFVVPNTAEERADNAVSTLKTPIVVEDHDDKTGKSEIKIKEPADAADKEPVEKKPITGDPVAPEAPSAVDTSDEDLIWVVVTEDGKEILKKVPRASVPEGARLASDSEISTWLKTNGNESK